MLSEKERKLADCFLEIDGAVEESIIAVITKKMNEIYSKGYDVFTEYKKEVDELCVKYISLEVFDYLTTHDFDKIDRYGKPRKVERVIEHLGVEKVRMYVYNDYINDLGIDIRGLGMTLKDIDPDNKIAKAVEYLGEDKVKECINKYYKNARVDINDLSSKSNNDFNKEILNSKYYVDIQRFSQKDRIDRVFNYLYSPMWEISIDKAETRDIKKTIEYIGLERLAKYLFKYKHIDKIVLDYIACIRETFYQFSTYRHKDYIVAEYKDNVVDIIFTDNADEKVKAIQQDSNIKKVFVGTTAKCTKDFTDLALFTGKKLYRLSCEGTRIVPFYLRDLGTQLDITPVYLHKNLSDNK